MSLWSCLIIFLHLYNDFLFILEKLLKFVFYIKVVFFSLGVVILISVTSDDILNSVIAMKFLNFKSLPLKLLPTSQLLFLTQTFIFRPLFLSFPVYQSSRFGPLNSVKIEGRYFFLVIVINKSHVYFLGGFAFWIRFF